MSDGIDAEDLWRRVGLDELRCALVRIECLTKQFEQALRALPPCSRCARVSLMEQIRETGGRLSGEAGSLSALAETLKRAVAAAEQTQAALAANAPEACHCTTSRCTCHE